MNKTVEINNSDIQLLIMGYIRVPHDKSLSITILTRTEVLFVFVNYGTLEIRAKIEHGTPFSDVVNQMKPLQYQLVRISVSQLKSIAWSDHKSEVKFTYDSGTKIKRYTTYINTETERSALLKNLQLHFSESFHYEEKDINRLKVALPHIAAGISFILILFWICFYWDPVEIPKIHYLSWILEMLGQKGCAVLSILLIIFCSRETWLAIKQKPRYHRYSIRN